jgi:hypothetical protein
MRDSKWRLRSILQLTPQADHDLYFDENPAHPSYHPPPGGGQAAVRRVLADATKWTLNRWVHTRATVLHEHAATIKLGVMATLWLLQLLQLSYFPLRAAFPETMALWQSVSMGLVTFNISRMSGSDPFAPAFLTCIVLALITIALSTLQVCFVRVACARTTARARQARPELTSLRSTLRPPPLGLHAVRKQWYSVRAPCPAPIPARAR